MPVGPDFISLQVRDLDTAAAFYEDRVPGLGIALWLKVDDTQALHDQLAGRGVTILTDPSDGPFGRTFALSDPDGYVITIHDGA